MQEFCFLIFLNIYCDLNVINLSHPDPVDVLQELYNDHREAWARHADHILSDKTCHPAQIPADNKSRSEMLIYLVDLNDRPIDHGGASITVNHDAESAGSTSIGPVNDLGNGLYSVYLKASLTTGTDIFRVEVDDGMGPITLYPFPTLELE